MANWVAYKEKTIDLPIVKRAKNGLHFSKGGEEVYAEFVSNPVHYLDGKDWKPIDTKLLLRGDGYYGCPHSPIKVSKDGVVGIDSSDYSQFTPLIGAQTGLIDNDRIVREFTGGRQYLYITETGFRQEIILDKMPSLKLAAAKKLLATVSGNIPLKYYAAQLTAVDANGSVYTYTNNTELIAWLKNAAYPVMIDPDIAPVAGTGDGEAYCNDLYSVGYAVAKADKNVVSTTGTAHSVGQRTEGAAGRWYVNRYFVLFDTSTITANGTVTQVNLKMTANEDRVFGGSEFDTQIVKQNWGGTIDETAWDGCYSGTADDSILVNSESVSNGEQYTSGNLSTAWVNKTGTTYYSLRSSRDKSDNAPADGTEEEIVWRSANHATESSRPVLVVAYTEAPSGALRRINMIANMQNLTGGIHG